MKVHGSAEHKEYHWQKISGDGSFSRQADMAMFPKLEKLRTTK
jgi:hypothetical protein